MEKDIETVNIVIDKVERVVIVCCPACSTENIIPALDYRLNENGSFILDAHYGQECDTCHTVFVFKPCLSNL